MDRLEQRTLWTRRWKAEDWIQHFYPLTGLTRENVLQYFAESEFYDKQSNNQVLRMQTQFQGDAVSRDVEEQLKGMVGIEFVVTESHPPDLFVIQKRYRESRNVSHPIAVYYCMNDAIFQAPDMYTLISARLLDATEALRSALITFRDVAPPFDIRQPAPRWTSTPERKDEVDINRKGVGADSQTDLLLRRALEGAARRKEATSASAGQTAIKVAKTPQPGPTPASQTPPVVKVATTPKPK